MRADIGSREPMSGLGWKNPCACQAPPGLLICCAQQRMMNMKTRISLLAAGIYLSALVSAFGQVTFTKITTGDIVMDMGFSSGCAWGDYNNDGFLDLFVANQQGSENYLYRNNG